MSNMFGIGTDGLSGKNNVLTETLSYNEKKAKNFDWAERCSRFIDGTLGRNSDEFLERIRVNTDLANGRGDTLMNNDTQFRTQKIDTEAIQSGINPVRHLPVINQIYDAMVGEQLRASLKFTTIDASGYSTTMRQKKRLDLNQQWIKDNVVKPVQDRITMQVMIENGVKDQSQLSPQDQQDLFADIESRTKFELVDDIDKFLAKDYKTPVETEVQKIVNWLVNECNIKYVTDENFKNVIIIGGEIYRNCIRNNSIKCEIVNQAGFRNKISKHKLFVEDSDIIHYQQSVSVADVINWHGSEIYKLKSKDSLMSLRSQFEARDAEFNRILASPGGDQILQNAPSIYTQAGQEYAATLKALYGSSDSYGYWDVNYQHYVWKSFGKMKSISRKTKQGVQIFYVDENYEFNPLKADIEEQTVIVPELYQATRINNKIFVDKGLLPYQYRSRQNPFEVKMNYIGAYYNTFGGNSKNVSAIDLGKPYQHKINVQVAKIEDLDRRNRGTVLNFPKGSKPKGMSWRDWLAFMNNEGILFTDDISEGRTANDMQAIRGITLSNQSELQGRIPYIEFLIRQMSTAMGFNPSRLGFQDPNLSVTNNRQNIVQSSIQTENIYRTHNKIIENVMTSLVKIAKQYLKDNPTKVSYILDDMSIAELSLDGDLLDIAEENIYINNSIEDSRKLEELNALAQPFIQNGQIDFEDAAKLKFAKNAGDILNIAMDSKRKTEARLQQQQEMQNQQIQLNQQYAQQIEQMRQEFELEKQKRDLENKIMITQIDAQKFANQWDIDNNQINDQLQGKMLDDENEKEKIKKQFELESKKLLQERELKLKEIEVKKMQARAKSKV